MGKGAQMAVGLATWVSIALDVMGWILLLSGVASMQNVRGPLSVSPLSLFKYTFTYSFLRET